MNSNLKKTLIGGLIATIAMTVIMIIAPMMGMPKMSIGNMLASFMGVPEIVGWIMHFMIGIIWAGVYVYFVCDKLNTSDAVKGMIFALAPWLIMQVMVMPMMGMGIFAAKAPHAGMVVMGTLIGHLVYGLVLGITTKHRPVVA
jgi:hypothetical protein